MCAQIYSVLAFFSVVASSQISPHFPGAKLQKNIDIHNSAFFSRAYLFCRVSVIRIIFLDYHAIASVLKFQFATQRIVVRYFHIFVYVTIHDNKFFIYQNMVYSKKHSIFVVGPMISPTSTHSICILQVISNCAICI